MVFGHVINTEPRDMYLSRVAAMEAGVPDSVPAMNVNRLCGSGVQAIVSAVQALELGDADFALAGGAESMSRSPYALQAARWGQKMGDTKAIDMMTGALTCPFGTGHMGVTAENVAERAPDQPRRPGRLRAREPEPRRRGDQGGPLRQPDRAGRGQGEARDRRLRHRRAPEGDLGRGARRPAAGVPQGRHGDGGQRQRHQRRRRGARARDRRGRRGRRAEAEGADPRLRPSPACGPR